MSRRRVIVIGAGTAGLCAAKNALEHGLDVCVYEQTKLLGGLWNYTDETGVDEHGLPFGYMYRELKTNVPKEIMRFTDFEVKFGSHSFLRPEEVVQFLHSYADAFSLTQVIQFQHQVVRVLPLKNGAQWEVLVKDLQSDRYCTEIFDYVMVCNGHHFHPMWPTIRGQELFPGVQKHSFDFRVKEEFQGEECGCVRDKERSIRSLGLIADKRVLVVGSGPSALDIAAMLSLDCASTVFLAHHIPFRATTKLADNITLKPDVQEITSTGAVFKDGSSCEVDAILYCTGFKYSFPFLSTECGISVDENYVQPLYKHVINIRHPSMAFVGLNFLVASQMHFDIQAQFAVKVWTSGRALPSAEEMAKDAELDLDKRLKRGWKRKHAHKIGDFMHEYYRELMDYAPDIRGMPPVYVKIWQTVGREIIVNYLNYRNDQYTVIDEETFEKTTTTTKTSHAVAEGTAEK